MLGFKNCILFVSFTEWTHEVLSLSSDNVMDHFRLLGAVEALAAILKVDYLILSYYMGFSF